MGSRHYTLVVRPETFTAYIVTDFHSKNWLSIPIDIVHGDVKCENVLVFETEITEDSMNSETN